VCTHAERGEEGGKKREGTYWHLLANLVLIMAFFLSIV